MSNVTYNIINCEVFIYDEETQLFSFVKRDVCFKDGKFVDHSEVDDEIVKTIDAKGGKVIPGFIDLQLNGGLGKSFSDPGLTQEDLEKIGKLVATQGCTSYYPTIISTTPETYKFTIPKCCPIKIPYLPEILGCHLEGPFLNEIKKGAHQPENLIKPIDNEDCEMIKSNLNYIFDSNNLKYVKNITIAPELSNSTGYIKLLKKHNIKISCGHSNISLDDLLPLIKNENIHIFTHFFNAMTPFDQREPGIIGLLGAPESLLKQIYYSIIVDGIHVHPFLVNMAYRLHPEGFIMITDANQFLGCIEGTYKHGNRMVTVTSHTLPSGNVSKKIVLADSPSVLVGSMAVKCSSVNAAKAMDINNTKGLIKAGYDADFLIIHENKDKPNSYYIQSTYTNGYCTYELK